MQHVEGVCLSGVKHGGQRCNNREKTLIFSALQLPRENELPGRADESVFESIPRPKLSKPFFSIRTPSA